MKFLLAVGADFGPIRQAQGLRQPRAEAARRSPPAKIIDALPLEARSARPRGPGSPRRTTFSVRRDGWNDRRFEAVPERRPAGVSTPRVLQAGPPGGVPAFDVPPGYDAGLRSALPALLDVTV